MKYSGLFLLRLSKMFRAILILISYSSLICCTGGFKQCGITVCLTWTVTVTELKLICKVNNLNFKVQIEDHDGQLQADCLPPIPESRCLSHVKNGSISQNVSTNETTFVLKGHIDTKVNGYWTCRHGTKVDLAKVDVTVLTIKDKTKLPQLKNNTKMSKGTESSSLSGGSCIFKTVFYSMVGFLATVIICLIVMSISNWNILCINDFLRTKCCGERYPFCKKLIFAILTASYFAVAGFVGWLYKDKCATISQWNVIGVAVPFALLFTILFSTKDNADIQHSNVSQHDTSFNNENHTDNQESQGLSNIELDIT